MAVDTVKRDMYDYIGQGNSLYDIIGRMIGVTDFTTKGMICNSLKLDKIQIETQTCNYLIYKGTKFYRDCKSS